MARNSLPEGDRNEFDVPPSDAFIEDVRALDPDRVKGALAAIIRESEDMRLRYMKTMQGRRFLTMTFGMISGLGGALAFGWFFLIQYDPYRAVLCILPAFIVPLLMNYWSELPPAAYRRDFKRIFMPKLAQALGGFKFNADRGVSAKILTKTGIVPPHDSYHAEDGFIGVYKGIKVLFSEARLTLKKNQDPVFRGLFVLIETPHSVFEGHTILTADRKMAQSLASTRWKKMTAVPLSPSNPPWDRFVMYSTRPEIAAMLAGDKLLKELSEACDAFDGLASIAFFGGKHVFLMVPTKTDMFEASNMHAPVSVKSYAENLRREIARILELIDIVDIYKPTKT